MFHGAGRGDLVRRIVGFALTRAIAIAIVIGTAFFLLAPSLVAAFSDHPEIREVGIGYLRIGVFAYPFIAIVMLTGRALQGAGQGLPLLVLSLLRVILISGPLAWFFVFQMGKPVIWVWIAILVGMVVSAVIALIWLATALGKARLSVTPGAEAAEKAGPEPEFS